MWVLKSGSGKEFRLFTFVSKDEESRFFFFLTLVCSVDFCVYYTFPLSFTTEFFGGKHMSPKQLQSIPPLDNYRRYPTGLVKGETEHRLSEYFWGYGFTMAGVRYCYQKYFKDFWKQSLQGCTVRCIVYTHRSEETKEGWCSCNAVRTGHPGSLATGPVAASSALSNTAPSQATQTQMIIFDYKEKKPEMIQEVKRRGWRDIQ